MKQFEEDIKACVKTLEEGGVILYPTDTVWGLGCDATNEQAVEKIYALKKRSESKSMIALLAEELDLLHYVASPPFDVETLLAKYNDRPTTVIYPQALQVASNAIAADGSMAFRICKEEFCYALLKRFRKSIISTSANISGEPTPKFFNEISEEVKAGTNYIVNYRRDDETPKQPSRILKWDADTNEMEIIRE
jgi:L-threonylcarbamoyladenylate synthase